MKLLSRVWLSAIPWTVAKQAPPSLPFSRQEYWSGLPFLSLRDLPDPGIKPGFPTLQADALPSKPPEKPLPNRKLGQFTGFLFFFSFLPDFKSGFNFYHNISSWRNNWAHFIFHFSSSLCCSFSFLAFLRKDWPAYLSCYSREPTTYPGARPSVNKMNYAAD